MHRFRSNGTLVSRDGDNIDKDKNNNGDNGVTYPGVSWQSWLTVPHSFIITHVRKEKEALLFTKLASLGKKPHPYYSRASWMCHGCSYLNACIGATLDNVLTSATTHLSHGQVLLSW